jgi:4'-phosphopantetheinyl transferase
MDDRIIRLWHSDCGATDVDIPYYWHILGPSEQQHALTLVNESIKSRYVEIRARLRILLGDVLNTQPDKLRIPKTAYGKPYLRDYPELSFNLSHTANKMVVAIANDCDLGIDIELCKARASLAGLVEKCFAEEEKHFWYQLADSEKTRAFYRFWTRKEAFVKAVGRGISLGLNRCVINPLNPTELLKIPDSFGQTSEWLIQDIDLDESICGAVVAKNKSAKQLDGTSLSLHALSPSKKIVVKQS